MSEQIHSINPVYAWQIYLVLGMLLVAGSFVAGVTMLGLAILNFIVAGQSDL